MDVLCGNSALVMRMAAWTSLFGQLDATAVHKYCAQSTIRWCSRSPFRQQEPAAEVQQK